MEIEKIGILGGGISGLTLQRELRERSHVLEKSDKPGGLCRTFWKDGFGYDIGGHILFSKNQTINDYVDALLGANAGQQRRANTVLYKGKYLKYPFENDLAKLGPEECYECLIDYLNSDYPKPTNFEGWMYYTFGKSIAEKYLIPYNRKIWKTEPSSMNVEWVERIPKPPKEDVIKSAVGLSTEGYTHQLHFRYPINGGAEALVTAVQTGLVTTNCNITSIKKIKEGWKVQTQDSEYTFEDIVINFPIHRAVKCFENVPQNVTDAINALRYTTIRVVLIAVNNKSLLDKSAIYIPDPEILPHRLCYMGYFSRKLVKPGTSSLIAEITAMPNSDIDNMSNQEIIDRTVSDLSRINVIDPATIITTDLVKCEFGYPVYDLKYRENVTTMREYFQSIDVKLLGRFAEFEYINSDECIRRAIVMATQINTL